MLKLGVQLHLTPALSKACHPHGTKEQLQNKLQYYICFSKQ